MKKVQEFFSNKFALLCLAVFSAFTTLAQEEGSGSIYDVRESRHVFNANSKAFPILMFGVVIIFLGYVGYRYWKDNLADN